MGQLSSREAKLEFGAARKDVGGQLFKQQRYMMAFHRYQHVVKILNEDCKRRGEDTSKEDELQLACESNMAMCLFKMGDLRGTIKICSRILERNRNNVKVLFRRASAYHGTGEFMLAVKDLNRALEISPDNADAKRLLVQAKQAQRQEDKASQAIYTKMCATGSKPSGE